MRRLSQAQPGWRKTSQTQSERNVTGTDTRIASRISVVLSSRLTQTQARSGEFVRFR